MKANVYGKLCTACVILMWVGLWMESAAHADPRLWGTLGRPVRVGTNMAWARTMIQDSAGNMLYVWSDERNGNPDIYAQLVNPAGVPQWRDGGVPVVEHPAEQLYPIACATSGGWVVAWIDYRTGWHYEEDSDRLGGDLYVQKLDYSGLRRWAYWDSSGLSVDARPTTIDRGCIFAVSDDSGGVMMAWESLDETDWTREIFVQHLLTDGSWTWNSPPLIASGLNSQYTLSAAPGGNRSLLLAWGGAENQWSPLPLFAAKVTFSGEMPWGEHGVQVSDSAYYYDDVRICRDGHDGAYIAWSGPINSQWDGEYDLWAQRLDANGQRPWGPNRIVVCNEQGYQSLAEIATSMNADTVDGAVLLWNDRRSVDWRNDIYVQKINPSGTFAWTVNGLMLADFYDLYPGVCSDLAGGLVATWSDRRNTNRGFQASGSRVNAAGQLLWGQYGIYVGDTTAEDEWAPRAFVRGNECYVGFERETDTLRTLRTQKLDLATGDRLYAPAGVPVESGLSGGAGGASAVTMADNKLGIIWSDYRGPYYYPMLYYQIMDSTGQTYLSPNGAALVPDCIAGNGDCHQTNLSACPDGVGGFYVTFEDQRNHVRAVHVNAAGQRTSDPAGVIVGDVDYNSEEYRYSYCASDGLGGCFVVFAYYLQGHGMDMRVVRINEQCQPVWANPTVFAVFTRPTVKAALADSTGSCIVVWYEGAYSPPSALKAARVLANGEVAWLSTLSTADYWSERAPVCSDGNGGAYLAFIGNLRSYYNDSMMVQHFNGQGTELWPHSGVLVSLDSLPKSGPALSVNSDGDLIVLWNGMGPGGNYYSNRGNLYGQKISPAGARLWGDYSMPLCSVLPGQTDPKIVCDNAGGFLAVWEDWRTVYTATFGNYFDRDARPVFDPYWGGWRGGQIGDTTASEWVGAALPMWNDAVVVQSHGYSLYAQRIQLRPALAAGDATSASPAEYALSQNYPNPFNPTTVISFALPKAGMTRLKVYDLLGRQVITLMNRSLPAGDHRVSFDATDLASGIYFYRLESGSFANTKKMVLVR